jgi:hypothetical protein
MNLVTLTHLNNGQQSSNGRAGIEYDNLSCDISEDSSSGMISENKINGIETDMPLDLISESSCSEYPSLDTPGPPTPMSSTVETGVNKMKYGETLNKTNSYLNRTLNKSQCRKLLLI